MGDEDKMLNPSQLEGNFDDFMNQLQSCAPEEVVKIDIHLLHSLGLLEEQPESAAQQPLTHYFHVVETADKITLFNERFVIWIVPIAVEQEPVTYTLVAQVDELDPKLELVLAASGVYNSSRIVLQVLEKMLEEIEENENVLAHFTDD